MNVLNHHNLTATRTDRIWLGSSSLYFLLPGRIRCCWIDLTTLSRFFGWQNKASKKNRTTNNTGPFVIIIHSLSQSHFLFNLTQLKACMYYCVVGYSRTWIWDVIPVGRVKLVLRFEDLLKQLCIVLIVERRISTQSVGESSAGIFNMTNIEWFT